PSQWEPAPQMAIHRGRPDLLSQQLDADPLLIRRQFDEARYGGARDLKGGTLLHLAAEFYERECVDLLLSRGADINARAFVDNDGIGGHSAIFHVAVSYKHFGVNLLRRFVEAGADLAIEANLPCTRMGCVPREEPRRVTPLGWARWHDHEWPLGGMAEEIAILRNAGAPE
ncbi:MAG: ankyrin repeat domain-containing protein, partial [Candidatus Methylacidiphilales bacterium]